MLTDIAQGIEARIVHLFDFASDIRVSNRMVLHTLARVSEHFSNLGQIVATN